MKLTIVNVAYPLAPVGPAAAGGAEQVLSHLDAALVAAGHRSIVLADERSVVAGELVGTPGVDGVWRGYGHPEAQARHRAKLAEILARERVDVVHLHGIDFPAYLPDGDVPVWVTLHLPPAWYPAEALRLRRPGVQLQCVSLSQSAALPTGVGPLPVIENGVDLDPPDGPRRKGGFVLTLGRICPEKGVHLAMAAAERARVPIAVAGRVFAFAAHQRYYKEEVAPRLGRRVRFFGAVGGRRKRWLLRTARAVLIPSTAPETSSLVAMEALAAGTPVIAFGSGALPEIVEHGVTGFIVNDVDEMAAAIAAVDTLSPETCRAVARRRFSAERMVAGYFENYLELARRAGGGRVAGEESAHAAA